MQFVTVGYIEKLNEMDLKEKGCYQNARPVLGS
jgi:hypothetical protein